MARPRARRPPVADPDPTPSEDGPAPGHGFAAELEAFEQLRPEAGAPEGPAGPAGPLSAPHRIGDRVRGRVVSASADVLLLDVGGRAEAVADAREFRGEDGELSVAVGDSLELHVIQAGEPLTLARAAPRGSRAGGSRRTRRGRGGSPGGGSAKLSVAALRQAREAGLPVRGRVIAVNPGGLTIIVDGVRAFCPLSHMDEHRVEDPAPFVGRTLEFLIEEVNEARSRVVVSRRRLLARQRAEALRDRLASLAPGQEFEGVVARLEPYGAFVDLGGLEGLVHVSEISHERLAHPRDALAAGDKVRVRVLEMDRGKGGRPRVSLSMRALAPDPWDAAVARFVVGSRHPAVVVRLADFGAFVNLAPGVDGLVHVSQVSDRRIGHVREVLSPGQAVEVLVLTVEPERRRISLSIREALASDPGRSEVMEGPAGEPLAGSGRARGERERRPPGERREERGARRPAARERGERRAGPGERGERQPGARERGERRPGPRDHGQGPPSVSPARPEEPQALTAMQLAFKRARERQRERER